MDDATTAFATACAVIAASTGMVLCLAPKNVNDAVIDDEPITKEEKEAVVEEETAAATSTTTEDAMKDESTPEPILAEEPVASDEATNDIAASTTEAVPEQRPDDTTVNDMTSPMKKKRRFTLRGDRTNRVAEGKSPARSNFRKSQSMKWMPFRPNNKKNDTTGSVGQEV